LATAHKKGLRSGCFLGDAVFWGDCIIDSSQQSHNGITQQHHTTAISRHVRSWTFIINAYTPVVSQQAIAVLIQRSDSLFP